jgi:hypothetical protein
MEKQLLLFADSNEEILERRMAKLEEKYDNLRKASHAKMGSILKICLELKSENESLKAAICRNSPIYREALF